MRFPGWRTLTSGPFLGNPSGVTIALMTAASNDVTFDTPVTSVSFFYASVVSVTLTAFDAGGGVVASASGPATGTASEDDDEDFALLELAANQISAVTVAGGQFQTAPLAQSSEERCDVFERLWVHLVVAILPVPAGGRVMRWRTEPGVRVVSVALDVSRTAGEAHYTPDVLD